MPSPALTPTEQKILDFIRSHLEEHGVAPSQTEIALHLGWKGGHKGSISHYLDHLENKGAIKRIKGHYRGIALESQTVTSIVRARDENMNFVDIPPELLTNDTKGLELMRYKDLVLVLSPFPPRPRDCGYVNIRLYDIEALGFFTGKHIITSDGKRVAALPAYTRRVLLVLQPAPGSI